MQQGHVVVRRTWPQRIVLLASGVVIAGALAGAYAVDELYGALAAQPRTTIRSEVLPAVSDPIDPVNFLLIGTDSTRGLDADDPILQGREVDPEGRSLADSIMILRVDPGSGRADVLSLPRDLVVDIPGRGTGKINSALYLGSQELIVETVSEEFGVEINHYVQIDFAGFRSIVDVLDGVPVWFNYPTQDLGRDSSGRPVGSGLSIPTPGCHVLDGDQALAYVRARNYQEFIDGRWVGDGGNDFSRIRRQQDFLVLAMERAIDKGARSPATLRRLMQSGRDSVLIDQYITLKDLIDLGQAFSDFTPENLTRHQLVVETVFNGDQYVGEFAVTSLNEDTLDIFRGLTDAVQPDDVVVRVADAGDSAGAIDAELLLTQIGFGIDGPIVDADSINFSTIVYGPDMELAALAVAQYVEPAPYLVEDEDASGVTLFVGRDYEQISFFMARGLVETKSLVKDKGEPSVVPSVVEGSEPTADPDEATTSKPTTSTTTTTTRPAGVDEESIPDPQTEIRGRAPEGESCG